MLSKICLYTLYFPLSNPGSQAMVFLILVVFLQSPALYSEHSRPSKNTSGCKDRNKPTM